MRRRLAEAGRLDWAETYYRNSVKWQALIYKYMFETLRRCPRMNGYDLLGAWDQHWHRSGYGEGFLNEFFELKPGLSAEHIRAFNGESVLLLDYGRRRSFRCGESFAMEALVSLYGGRNLEKGVLSWSVSAGGRELIAGRRAVAGIQAGAVTALGAIEFQWPVLDKPVKVGLGIELRGQGCRLANAWDFWLFPPVRPLAGAAEVEPDLMPALARILPGGVPPGARERARLRILAALRADDLAHLRAGGDVLLLGHAPFPARETSFQIAVAGRPNGNDATVIHPHPVWEGFPHEGWCDWQFQSLLEASATVFNDLPVSFQPILEVVSSYKAFCWQAALWEARVGTGRLFAAACRFDPDDPAAQALLLNIIRYARGGDFNPPVCLDAKWLETLVKSGAAPRLLGGTDMGHDSNAQPRPSPNRRSK